MRSVVLSVVVLGLLAIAHPALGSRAATFCTTIPTSSGGMVNLNQTTAVQFTLSNTGGDSQQYNWTVSLCSPTSLTPAGASQCSGNGGYGGYYNKFDAAGNCIASFQNVDSVWGWNGTALVSSYTASAEPNAKLFVTVYCGSSSSPKPIGDVGVATDGTTTNYSVTFETASACVSEAPATPVPTNVPFKTDVCTGAFCGEVPAYLTSAVASHGSPGMSAAAVRLINTSSGSGANADWETLYIGAFGRYTYDITEQEVTTDTLFDMASCTKVVTTTTATAQLDQLGLINRDHKVSKYLGNDFNRYHKENISVWNLLTHTAGFPPDPNPGYSSPIFPCPENANYHPGQQFTCYPMIFDSVLNQTLAYKTGTQYIYSDLSFITLMFVVGKVVKDQQGVNGTTEALRRVANVNLVNPCNDPENLICWFHAYVHEFVFKAYNMPSANFIPVNPGLTPPQWFDPWYHHSLIWGYVSDQNAYAMGGISGHAGLFASVKDSIQLMQQWMAPAPHRSSTDPSVLSEDIVAAYIQIQNKSISSRALGWDTMYDPLSGQWCGSLSKKTFFHIGFTGTQLCGDPVNKVFTVLLANGRYPNYHEDGMIPVRVSYNTLIQKLL